MPIQSIRIEFISAKLNPYDIAELLYVKKILIALNITLAPITINNNASNIAYIDIKQWFDNENTNKITRNLKCSNIYSINIESTNYDWFISAIPANFIPLNNSSTTVKINPLYYYVI